MIYLTMANKWSLPMTANNQNKISSRKPVPDRNIENSQINDTRGSEYRHAHNPKSKVKIVCTLVLRKILVSMELFQTKRCTSGAIHL